MNAVFLPTNESVTIKAMLEYSPPVSSTSLTSLLSTYDENAFLTKMDKLNRSRGYSMYIPDSYSKVKLYWELAYGIKLPTLAYIDGSYGHIDSKNLSTNPCDISKSSDHHLNVDSSGSSCSSRPIFFLIETQLAERIVPIEALAR